MASTKSTRTTRRRSSTTKAPAKRTSAPQSRNREQGFMATVKDRPVASAAIGTGLLTGLAAAVAGFFAFKKSGKSFSEFSDDIATDIKDKASEASEFVKDGLADAKAKAKSVTARRKDGTGERSQAEIAEEAMTLKETGNQPSYAEGANSETAKTVA